MKIFIRITLLAIFFGFGYLNAQNVFVNGNVESWTAGLPDGWTVAENITQESTIVHEGSSSAKHTSEQLTKDLQQLLTGIQGGEEYTISYWYFDNVDDARTRIWTYWTSAGANLPDHGDILRPNTYSENSANWQQFSTTLVAPASADGVKFEVRVYNQDGNYGGSVYYDDFIFSGDIVVDPEPTNYPTAFSAIGNGLNVDLSWNDAVGTQLPSSYLIMAGTSPSLTVPTDGMPVMDDMDLSDGNGALNVPYGEEMTSFFNLDGNTTYHFAIYSYTNSGANIDYKNDGTAPTASASTSNVTIIEFENFDDSWGNWSTVSVIGAEEWDRDNTYGLNNTPCARMSGYNGGPLDNEDWLISPPLNLDDYENETLNFFNAKNYDGDDMLCFISTDYAGSGDPNLATWSTLNYTMCAGNWEWTESGTIDISAYNGSSVFIGFKYTCNTTSSATWEVEDITIAGEEDVVIDPEPSNYPTTFTAMESGTVINLEWNDATGAQLPDAYIIYAGINASLPAPVDGTPVPNDTDLSDGSGAINISYGIEQTSFAGLDPATTYYFSIYPYTNNGNNIDYKTDGTAPTANATTSNTVTATIEEENFDESWGNWSIVSVLGTNEWERDNTWGIGSTPCASVTGYMGGTPPTYAENEDWLISPAMNFNDYENEKIVFFNAQNYTGPDMEFKISTDYSGSGDPNLATWTTLTYTMSSGSFDWTNSGDIDLSTYNGSAVYVAFMFTSTDAASATWEVDDILITGEEEFVIDPEPSNYPTAFDAEAAGTIINLTWDDATGTQLPDDYIIFAGINASLPTPADGTPVPNDTDLSDGSGAINVSYGDEGTSFAGLDPATTYYFSIYPYTNSGVNIDYKNDGTAPTANAETSNTVSATIEEENFDEDWGNWTKVSVLGTNEWERDNTWGIGSTPCASATGYMGGTPPTYAENEDWLISPAMNFNDYEGEKIEFFNAQNYTGPDMEFKVSTDYSGSGDPNLANWTNLSYTMSTGSFEWTSSGEIDLSSYNGSAVYVAFVFTSTDAASATWEVDDILITGEEEFVIEPEPTNYPTAFEAEAAATSINITWTDATGTQLPDDYIIYAGISASLPAPTDGTPVPNDTDLSDGSGAINVGYGAEQTSFTGLDAATTYYFSIYPYTNSGVNIDYKNDGTAPTADATTANTVAVTIEEENFDDSWGSWTRVSVLGTNEWERDNTWGVGSTPCASATGYMGGTPPTYAENEDWLISPALNFDDYAGEKIVFYNAQNYSGPDMEFKVSTDYSGSGDPNQATWESKPYTMSTGSFEWTNSGEIDLSSYNGNAVYVAFLFTCTSSGSATWEVDDILITGEEEAVIEPEPTNYPTNFSAGAISTNVGLSWTDATGDQLPAAYIIFASTEATLPMPTDGVPVPDDTNLSDGSGALNVDFGTQQASFNNLDPSTTYYFSIYSYTNSGVNTDYKNDGTAPTAEAITGYSPVIEFEDFNEGWGNWTPISIVGDQVWTRDNNFGLEDTPCAKMSGFANSMNNENDDWLVSPELNLNGYESVLFSFHNATQHDGNAMEVKISTDYDGGGNPNTATWTSLNYTLSAGNYEWTFSGEIDLSSYIDNIVYVAFQYTSTNAASAIWEVDDVLIESDIIIPEPSNYPTNFIADETGSNIILNWTEAIGPQLPEAYVIFASTNASLPVPQDGSPVANDPDLSNGSGAMNIAYGVGEFTFTGYAASTTYYFSIYSYTNGGEDINYKNDGTAPTTSGSTSNSVAVTIEEENFDESWGNWTRISVLGSNEWERDNTWGVGSTPCASVTGYMGGTPPTYAENEDWLVSPAMNFNNYENEKIVFYNAMNYSGPAMEFKISTDYDGGGDPNSANWTNLSYTMSTGEFNWTNSGEINLSSYSGNAVYVAFIFTCTNSGSATWEVDDIVITGEEEYVVKPEPTNYPESFMATSLGLNIKTSWDDAGGTQAPDGYVVFARLTDDLPVPVDGVPIQVDTDLGDGEASVSVAYGEEMYLFEMGLDPFTQYFFAIYPFTNVLGDINYKNDGTAPTSFTSTTNVIQVVLEEENFNEGWGLWERVSEIGVNEWDRNNTYGPDYTACAAMTGYMGGSPPVYEENEDWLISPALDLVTNINCKLEFMNAKNYSGPDMEVKVSTDYTGNGDPNSATWTTVPYDKSGGDFTWVSSGTVELYDFASEAAHIAFIFTCASSGSATWEVDNVVITAEEVLGIRNSNALQHNISVYPNPTDGLINLKSDSDDYYTAEVRSTQGNVVKRFELNGKTAQQDLSDLRPGIYFILFINKETNIPETHKLVIQ